MPAILRFDSFEVDLAAHQLSRHGTRIHLRDQSFQVLAVLMERAGEAVTRQELRHRLWTDETFVDFENNLNTAVARLREALCDSADHPRYIETLPRLGYRFIAAISRSTDPGEPSALPRPSTRLIVLPFVNSSGDPSREYFSDAMTGEIITELSTLAPAALSVIARTTAMHYKSTHKDVAAIGRELSVQWAVEGSARGVDDRVSLTVQLVRVSDQTHVFARRYDGDLDDVVSLAQSVARAVGSHVGIPSEAERIGTGAATEARAHRRRTQDRVAYDFYLQGRYFLDRGLSPEGWAHARRHLEAALTRDPQLALAHDALAELWWETGFFAVAPPTQTLALGTPHAVRAVEIDGTLAEAHAMLAQYRKQVDFDWTAVRRELALALELNPTSAIVRRRCAATGLMPFGRLDEAIGELEFAFELDPLGIHARMWLVVLLWLNRQYDRAIEQGRLLIESEPTHFAGHFLTGVVCREAGLHEDAILSLRKGAELSGGNLLVLGWLGLALAESGDVPAARALLERLRGMPAETYVPPTSFAWIHIGLGEIDQFFEWMGRAIDARDHMIMPIKSYAFFDPIRGDPRYTELLHKMNLD
jgi:TolB-like protein/tetratricopeptide (TPR) repeat protein